jgi:hypothetical protein
VTRITWHNCQADAQVWCLRRSHWRSAVVIHRGHSSCRVRFTDTGNCTQRRYEELVGRIPSKRGSDRPDEVNDKTKTEVGADV